MPPSDFITMPWKNGGGTTHEILKHEEHGRLLWRLSIAEVASDGPFSVFAGLTRILTVIGGDGLDMRAPHVDLEALPFIPLTFSGDWAINATRRSAVVDDFNVIFDNSRVDAKVVVWQSGEPIEIIDDGAAIKVLLLLGSAEINGKIVTARTIVVCENFGVTLKCDGAIIQTSLHLR